MGLKQVPFWTTVYAGPRLPTTQLLVITIDYWTANDGVEL